MVKYVWSNDTSNSSGESEFGKRVEVPCQSCGKLVTVMVPFYGCVFCGDCKITQDNTHYVVIPDKAE